MESRKTIRKWFWVWSFEKEEEWLKSSDRPYKVIEERVVELSNRKNAIMQGINALISD